ncbi:hypothetical protein [Moorena producens]|uniref:hypothetical protein n=1 Tax=Moorena producens TaxID=1155739 RepID=UPI003C791AFB
MDLLAVDVGHYDTLALSDGETRVWGVGCGVWGVGCREMGRWGNGEMGRCGVWEIRKV